MRACIATKIELGLAKGVYGTDTGDLAVSQLSDSIVLEGHRKERLSQTGLQGKRKKKDFEQVDKTVNEPEQKGATSGCLRCLITGFKSGRYRPQEES